MVIIMMMMMTQTSNRQTKNTTGVTSSLAMVMSSVTLEKTVGWMK